MADVSESVKDKPVEKSEDNSAEEQSIGLRPEFTPLPEKDKRSESTTIFATRETIPGREFLSADGRSFQRSAQDPSTFDVVKDGRKLATVSNFQFNNQDGSIRYQLPGKYNDVHERADGTKFVTDIQGVTRTYNALAQGPAGGNFNGGGRNGADRTDADRNGFDRPAPPLTPHQRSVQDIMQKIGDTPDPTSMGWAKGKLAREADAGNDLAKDKVKQLSVDILASDLRNPASADKAMKGIVDLAKGGNSHARDALAAVLVPQDKADAWQKSSGMLISNHSYKGRSLPDTSALSAEQQASMRNIAATGLREVAGRNGGLSQTEAFGMGLSLSDAANKGLLDGKLATTIRATFADNNHLTDGKENPQRQSEFARRVENSLNGLFGAIKASGETDGSAGRRELVSQYARQASSENNQFIPDPKDKFGDIGTSFKRQTEELVDLAKTGNNDAISMLAAIAGGAGKANSKANHWETDGNGRPIQGDRLALSASNSLTAIAKESPAIRTKILDELTSPLHTKEIKDSSHKLETLGKVAALNPDDVPSKVRETLRAGLERETTRESAARGMVAIGKDLDRKDIQALSRHMDQPVIEALKFGAHRLSPESGAQLSDALAERASNKHGIYSPEERLNAINGLAAVGPRHATTNSIAALQQLGERSGRNALDTDMKRDSLLNFSDDRRATAVSGLQAAAANALLTTAEKSPEQQRKTDAFKALASSGDWGADFKYADNRPRLQALMRNNPENVSIQGGVPKLVHGLDRSAIDKPGSDKPAESSDGARLAAAFRDRGAALPDNALLRLSNLAVKKYGKAETQNVSDRLALFNALPEEQRKELTGSNHKLNPDTVLARMANGTLTDDAAGKALSGKEPLEHLVNGFSRRAGDAAITERSNLFSLTALRNKEIDSLAKHSEVGVGWLNKLSAGLSDSWSAGQKEFIKKQESSIVDVASLDKAIEKQRQVVEQAQARVQALDIAGANHEFAKLSREGKTFEADKLAMSSFAQHGRKVMDNAPDIARALVPQNGGADSGVLARALGAGNAHIDRLQVNTKIGTNQGLETGLKMLASIKPAGEGKQSLADAAMIRKEALAGLDADPTIAKVNKLGANVADQLGTLNGQIGTMRRGGDKFDSFIADAQARGKAVKDLMAEVTPDDLKRLNDIHAALGKSLKDGSVTDESSKKEVKGRFDALDSALRLFDPKYSNETHHPEKLARKSDLEQKIKNAEDRAPGWARTEPPHDDLYKKLFNQLSTEKLGPNEAHLNHAYWKTRRDESLNELRGINSELNQRQNIDKAIEFLQTPAARNPSTFKEWMKTDGIELAGSIAGAAAVAGAMVVFWPSAPLVASAALGTAGFMAGRELTKEIQHTAGLTNQSSLVGEYARGRTVQQADGSERKLELGRDVALPLTKELAMGTAIGWGAGGVGHALGEGLRKLGSNGLALFGKQNAPAIAKLTSNVAELEGLAAKNPAFASFAKAALKDAGMQTALMPVTTAGEHGLQKGLQKMGAALEEGNVVTSFLLATAISTAFALKPQVKTRQSGSASAGHDTRTQLHLEYAGSSEQVASYVKEAQRRGSTIEESKGGFRETTKEGFRVEWSRAADGALPAVDATLRTSASLTELPHGGKPGTTRETPAGAGEIRPDAKAAAELQTRMDNLMEPVRVAQEKIQAFEAESGQKLKTATGELNAIPATPEGDQRAAAFSKTLNEERRAHDNKKADLQKEADQLRSEIRTSDTYRMLEMSKSLAEGKFPPGEYRVKLPDGESSVTLNVGRESYLDGKTLKMRSAGAPVPAEHVNELMKSLAEAKIRPDSVSITHGDNGREGGMGSYQGRYEISVNTGSGNQPVRMIYNHETGHLYDLTSFRKTATPEVWKKIDKAYADGLATNGAADAAAKYLGLEPTHFFAQHYNDALSIRADYFAGRIKTPMDFAQYLGSRGEMFAEMFKLHQEQTRVEKATGKSPSYGELLDKHTAPYQQTRADMMRNFEGLYKVLAADVFPNVRPVSNSTRSAALDGRKTPATAEGTARSLTSPEAAQLSERADLMRRNLFSPEQASKVLKIAGLEDSQFNVINGKMSREAREHLLSFSEAELKHYTNLPGNVRRSLMPLTEQGAISGSTIEALAKHPGTAIEKLNLVEQAKLANDHTKWEKFKNADPYLKLDDAVLSKSMDANAVLDYLSRPAAVRQLASASLAAEMAKPLLDRTQSAATILERASALQKFSGDAIGPAKIWNEHLATIASGKHATDLFAQPLLEQQLNAKDSHKLKHETLGKLLEFGREQKISPMAMEQYVRNIKAGVLDDAALTKVLDSTHRPTYEALLHDPAAAAKHLELPTGKTLTEFLHKADSLATAKAAAEVAPKLDHAKDVLSASFPEGGTFKLEKLDLKPDSNAGRTRQFLEALQKGDFADANKIVFGAPSSAAVKVNDIVVEVSSKSLHTRNGLEEALAKMTENKSAGYSDLANADGSDKAGTVLTPKVHIKLDNNTSFSLSDASKITRSGISVDTTPQERKLIESFQQSRNGKALLAKESMIFFEERLVHANQNSTGMGMVSELNQEFAKSKLSRNMNADPAVKDIYKNSPEFASRETDVAAILREAGVPTAEVQALLKGQHEEARHYFYKWLKENGR